MRRKHTIIDAARSAWADGIARTEGLAADTSVALRSSGPAFTEPVLEQIALKAVPWDALSQPGWTELAVPRGTLVLNDSAPGAPEMVLSGDAASTRFSHARAPAISNLLASLEERLNLPPTTFEVELLSVPAVGVEAIQVIPNGLQPLFLVLRRGLVPELPVLQLLDAARFESIVSSWVAAYRPINLNPAITR